MELYGDELAKAIEKVGGADDVIRLITEYSDSAEDILKAISTYGDDVVELITVYGDEAVDLFKAGMSADEVKEVLGGGRISYDKFKELNKVEQVEVFSQMSSKEIYELVKNSPDSWTVEAYDLITPDNAKYFIKITNNSFGGTAFNLNWPKYGGYEPNTISSIDDLSGKVPVSRDGGYTMGIGKNPDGTYANNSQRAIPKSSAEVNTGTFDVDLYKSTVDIVVAEGSDFSKINKLVDIGIDEEIAEDLLSDYKTWLTRPEIIGDDNISDGLLLVEKNVDSKYGYYGIAAEWNVGDVKMSGGAGQMNTVYSWGTLKEAGIITDIGKAIIN